jgi:hypothetical protein
MKFRTKSEAVDERSPIQKARKMKDRAEKKPEADRLPTKEKPKENNSIWRNQKEM